MKKVLLIAVLLLSIPVQVFACGGFEGFVSAGRNFETKDDTNVLVWFRNNTETYVVEPSFQGNAEDFGVVLPFPSQPTIQSAPSQLFSELETLGPTMQPASLSFGMGLGSSRSNSVTVQERKDVGDFHTTTLTATSADGLIQWLKNNGYAYSQEDESNFQYYIQKGGYYFVALKANTQKVAHDENGTIEGRLKPLAFTFTTSAPTVAMRISAGNKMPMNFVLYTLSDRMYFVPGVEVVYSNMVTNDLIKTVPSLLKYDGINQWITKSVVNMDPHSIQEDLQLHRAQINQVVDNESLAIIPNISNIPVRSGIVLSTKGSQVVLTEDNSSSASMIGDNYLLKMRTLFILLAVLVLLTIFLLIKKRKKRTYTPYRQAWSFFNFKTIGVSAIPIFVLIGALYLLLGIIVVNHTIGYATLFIIFCSFLGSYIFAFKKNKWKSLVFSIVWQVIILVLFVSFFLFYQSHQEDLILIKDIFTL